MTRSPSPRPPRPTLRVVAIEMADGTDIDSPQARARIVRAFEGIHPTPTVPAARQEQPQASGQG